MIRYTTFGTALGDMYATLEGDALTGVYFVGGRHAPAAESHWRHDPGGISRQLKDQMEEYLVGGRKAFDLPLAPRGTAFQLRVWKEIARIPFGQTITYAELAARSGSADAVRAVGAATGRNPLSIVVPCHRVMGSGGSLTGYAGGLERKRRLLEIEGALQPALV